MKNYENLNCLILFLINKNTFQQQVVIMHLKLRVQQLILDIDA